MFKRVLLALTTLSVALTSLALVWLNQRPYAPHTEIDARVVSPFLHDLEALVSEYRVATAVAPTSENFSAPLSAFEPAAIPSFEPIHPGLDTENILLLGLDRHPDYKRGGRTDTILVAAFERGSQRVGLVSIPRDLWVSVKDHGEARINSVYGLAKRAKQDPLQAVERVIEDTFGLPIAHTVAIDLGVFEAAVDAVGGVDVEVSCPIQDNFIDSRVEGGRRVLNVEAGSQHMDGVTASMYVRSRHGRSDFSRARRQQAVLLAVRRKLREAEGLSTLTSLLAAFDDKLETHMTRLELLTLSRRVLGVKPGHLHGVVIGSRETTPFRTEQNWSVLLPDAAVIEARLSGLFSAPLPGASLPLAACPSPDAALRRKSK